MRSQPLRRVVNTAAVVVAVSYLVFVLTIAVLNSFADGAGPGVRSLAATLLPLFLTLYLGFLSGIKLPINRNSRSPLVNNFVLLTLWTLLIMGLVSVIEAYRFPLLELLYSLTLSVMIWRFKQGRTFASLAACGYGMFCGGLIYTVLFGWPHGA